LRSKQTTSISESTVSFQGTLSLQYNPSLFTYNVKNGYPAVRL